MIRTVMEKLKTMMDIELRDMQVQPHLLPSLETNGSVYLIKKY